MTSTTTTGTVTMMDDEPNLLKLAIEQHFANLAFGFPAASGLSTDWKSKCRSSHGQVTDMADGAVQPPPAYPLSLEEIEGLVNSLYGPGKAQRLPETEATLRVLQRSPQGWDIADALMNSSVEQVRFFGALTFTIKLNHDSAGLSEEASQQLLYKLVHHLVLRPSFSSVATRKLCSTLAQYFCKPIAAWTMCIRSLAVSFAQGQPVLDDALSTHASTWDILPSLSDDQLLCLLEVGMNLADEAKKIANLPDRSAHERLVPNVESIEAILQVAFGRGIKYLSTHASSNDYMVLCPLGDRICGTALKCFIGWIYYAQSEFKGEPEKMKYLRSVTELALACLEFHVDDAMDLVAEVLENYPKFFDLKQQEMLWAAIMSPWGMEILKNLDAETVSLARIIVTYGQILLDARILYREPDNAHHQQVMSVLHELLKYPQPVGVEDDVAPVVLDFWNNYVSTVAEELFQFTEEIVKPAWVDDANANVLLAVSEFLQKITFPAAAITKDWSSEEKKTFKVFRIDVRDIVQEAFEVLRDVILDQFLNFAIQALETGNWMELEAGMFCLNAVSEALAEPADEHMQRLFERPLFTVMLGTAEIPALTRRTAVEMVASFNMFFLRHPEFLPQVLPFLLSALAQPSLAHSAAKSFASLCSECRKSLTSELTSFFQMYEQFLGYQTAEEFTKSKVLEGIAAIVQAQASDGERLPGVQQLFRYVTHDAMQAINITKEGYDPEQGQILALTTLKCLAGIGKSLQASDEDVIDLESEHNPSQYWTQGPGKEIQNQIINFVNYLTQVFIANSEVIEAACDVLRVGLKETVPGPFVLPPSAFIDFITKTSMLTPRLPYVLETACCFISSHKSDNSEDYQLQAQRLLHHILAIMQGLQHPSNDPEISVGCIEVIQKFISTNAAILVTVPAEVLKGMFDFSVECIRSPEVLPKRAAASLWKDIFELSGSTKNQHQPTGQEITIHFGPAVTSALIFNVCGEVDGSSLDQIVVPLRKIIQSDRNAKTYITNSLAEQPLIIRIKDDPATQDIIRKFVEGLVRNARSSMAFKQTVKDFWTKCKQMQMQFAPQTMHPGHRAT